MHGSSWPRPVVDHSAELCDLIISGGDERLDLDDGLNKYHLDPRTSAGTLHRGSCTCSPLNDAVERAASGALDALRSGSTTTGGLLAHQRRRLLDLFVPEAGADDDHHPDVIFAPSGSDLCYLPLLFSSLVDPGRRIVNVVATSEELGSGSLLAHDGRFFAGRSQIDDQLVKGDPISDGLLVESVFLPARAADGAIVDQGRRIEQLISERRGDDALIVNLVIGSKSGIENGVRIVERFADDDIMWTVDLCQMRARPALFDRLLELGCLLLCTGSKFYEVPPFCGAMLVPSVWIRRLARLEEVRVDGFDRIFSSLDFPPSLPGLVGAFDAVDNVGLRLRWEAALHEMELFDAVPEKRSAAMITEWHERVVERIARSNVLELLGDQDETNDSIVSFRIRNADNGFLDREQLADVHRRLATEEVPEIAPHERAMIGQPVSYTSGSFLRVAIGSCDVRRAVADNFDPTSDLALIDAIERVGEDVR